MKITNYLSLPRFFRTKFIKYFAARILQLKLSPVESNWIYFIRLAIKNGYTIKEDSEGILVYNADLKHSAFIRKESSDVLVYIQIFFHHEYQTLIDQVGKNNIKTILDAGANVGYFALYAQNHFPESSIYCIEPARDNCAQIARQALLNNYTRWQISESALWPHNGTVDFEQTADNLEWSASVKQSNTGAVRAISLAEALRIFEIQSIDIFKIDIEGAEMSLFSDETFLDMIDKKVKVIAMETHNADEEQAIKQKLELLNFRVEQKSELLFAFR